MNKEQKIFDSCKSRVSPLGQFHYRGYSFPYNQGGVSVIPGQFHSNEDGDASYHTGILGQSLVWRWVNDESKREETEEVIDRILKYYEYFIEHVGHIGRNIVSKEAYNLFPKKHKHGDKEWSLFKFDKAGMHMRYKEALIENKKYYLRYDVSGDQIISSVSFLYWIVRFFPSTHLFYQRAVNIAKSHLNNYKENSYEIRDEDGKLLRYGIHWPWPLVFPINKLIDVILKIIVNKNVRLSLWDKFALNLMRTFIKGFYLSKRERKAFNNYMMVMGMICLYKEDININSGLRRLLRETLGEDNYFNNIIYNKIFDKLEPYSPLSINIKKIHLKPYTIKEYIVPHDLRYGHNLWEASPYREVDNLIRFDEPDGIGGHDILHAYWAQHLF